MKKELTEYPSDVEILIIPLNKMIIIKLQVQLL